MAQETAKSRWPKLVQGMIDDVGVTGSELDPSPALDEIKSIQRKLKRLREGIVNNDQLCQLEDDGSADIAAYNQLLLDMGILTWLNCPWLYGECYLYRRVQLLFSTSSSWKDYDVFKRQKNSTLIKSQKAVQELASRFTHVIANPAQPVKVLDDEPARLVFVEMSELALWGNATDLSLLTNLSLEEIQTLQGRSAIEKSQRNIVDNDISDAWDYLRNAQSIETKRHIDIILDNAGFELFADVLYAAYLIESGLGTSITLHAKCFPWFVSDALPDDMDFLLEYLQSVGLESLATQIKRYFELDLMSIEVHPFWMTAYSFHEMKAEAPGLFRRLHESHLTIWKGDLNYRKLTRDGLWPYTTAFKSSLGPLGQGSGVKILALRTNKSDTCVGIESEKKVKSLNLEAPGMAWVRNGKYAVISFSDGR
ncbi:Hairy/enhancer-of-split with YRPW motif protein 2 [Fusarium torreyae]|uniref:Sugar phosphate phosphatase n=1 Tax=Fusarium torreyae TaxID=1237075 RepID=A0A9W8RI70_9HYPO|nr:Hairy/enhancer-of-split with YRPW motif protein 2 [Fusarium torreyae]